MGSKSYHRTLDYQHQRLICITFTSNSGMARIFTAAPGLVKLMDRRPWGDTQLPDVYEVTPARIDHIKQTRSSSAGVQL